MLCPPSQPSLPPSFPSSLLFQPLTGPKRNLAPLALACLIDSLMRSRFPSKSKAHWFRLHVATVMRDMVVLGMMEGEGGRREGGGRRTIRRGREEEDDPAGEGKE